MVGGVQATTYTSQYPPGQNDTYVKATSYEPTNYYPYYATDPTKSLVDSYSGNGWASASATTNQRFHIDLGEGKIITRVYYENLHATGDEITRGVRNYTVWGSNTAGSFANLTYVNDTGWVQITPSQSSFDQHSAANEPDPKYITLTNSDSYRYYAFKFADNWGGTTFMGVRRIELQTTDAIIPVASFTSANITPVTNTTSEGWSGIAPFSMQFTNTSSLPPHTSFVWNATNVSGNNVPFTFNATTYYNPIYAFQYPGNYTIKLNITGTYGANISTQITWVNVTQPVPVASFTTDVTSGYSPLSVQFTDTSTNDPTSWDWYFVNATGNNTEILFSTSQNPLKSFGVGNYTTKLKATNDGGSGNSSLTWINVSWGAPIAAFNANITTGVNPMMVMFNDTSTAPVGITSYNTSFGDNSWTNQTSFPGTNITHLYSTAGIYIVDWYVTNVYGTGTATANITVYGSAHSNFSSFNTAGTPPFTTYLYDTSTNLTPGPATYYWDLGDGNTSTSQNFYFTWNSTGAYTVAHSMNNGLSTSWNNKTDYVNVGGAAVTPVASFNGTPSLGAAPLNEFFVDVSSNTPTSWYWMFGDGSTSTSQNPSHWYNTSGFFTVNFSATNAAGTGWENKTNFVVVY